MTNPSPPPAATAVRLGYLATLPFLAGAALVWIVDAAFRPSIAQALSDYAAVVIAFIGAIHWGLAFREPRAATASFVWGVVPSIVAWIALLLPLREGLALEGFALIACYLVDRATYPRSGAARWLPLRLRLTGVAALACLVGAVGS